MAPGGRVTPGLWSTEWPGSDTSYYIRLGLMPRGKEGIASDKLWNKILIVILLTMIDKALCVR